MLPLGCLPPSNEGGSSSQLPGVKGMRGKEVSKEQEYPETIENKREDEKWINTAKGYRIQQ
jgi:hypothetical protein